MVEVEEKGKAHASGSEPENMDSIENADAETAASDPAKSNVEVQTHASGPAVENNTSADNAVSETAASELVKINGIVPATIPVSEKGEENENEDNKGKTKENQTVGESSKKRKRKKVVKKRTGKASVNNANAEKTAPGEVKLNTDVAIAIAGVEETGEEKKAVGNEEQTTKEKVDNTVSTTPGKSRKRKRKKVTKGPATVPAKDTDKPETSTKQKDEKKESMGMIFMCSSKTKQDCYRYKVFGLPAAKKDAVAEIYKGMRLFLFDIDLKLMYGIYKAAEPGGYNIEPKAFKSAFPAQVRFTIVEDCLPLAEEKFKAVIRDNYYGKNKFNCQLKAEQVKNLCKLFKATVKGRESKPAGGVRKTERPQPAGGVRKTERPQPAGGVRKRERRVVVDRSREKPQGRDRERRSGGDRERRSGRDRDRQQGRDRGRRAAFGGARVAPRAADGVYGRGDVFTSAVHAPQLPPPLSAPPTVYAYERALDADYYRRDAPLERAERHLLDFGLSRREEVYRDPHESYTRAPPLAHEPSLSYRESLYTRLDRDPPLSYLEPSYARAPPAHETTRSYARAPPAHETSHSYREPLYTRLVHETPLPYHESSYARAPAHDPMYRY